MFSKDNTEQRRTWMKSSMIQDFKYIFKMFSKSSLLLITLLLLFNFPAIVGSYTEIDDSDDYGNENSDDNDYNNDVIEHFTSTINKLFRDVTKYDELKAIYEKQLRDGVLQKTRIEVANVTDLFGDRLTRLLTSHVQDLNRIKEKLQQLKHEYGDGEKLSNEFNYSCENPVQCGPHFSRSVRRNFNRSLRKVPTDIFKCSKAILHTFKWTEKVDEVFISNYKRNPLLEWQYFTSETGATRIYPGYQNSSNDAYNEWTRLWYNKAINSPKDIVILLDMSGSMAGTHFRISKFLLHLLISNFQQDDFFNVITFNNETNYLIPCIQNLTQATSFYKKAFINAVDSLDEPINTSDVPDAFSRAFQTIANSSFSSGCMKVIMLISDGIDSSPSIMEVLEKYNSDKHVIIFSYIIGRKGSNIMKNIACSNGGEYYNITAMGSVLDQALKYQKILSKSLAREHSNHTIFTALYKMNEPFTETVSTIATAVFDSHTISNSSGGELLGVTRVDITEQLLRKQYPKQQMGVFGHAFAINNNGLFLTHPRLKQHMLRNSREVYLDDLERTINKESALEIAQAMIENEGCQDSWTNWFFPEDTEHRVTQFKFKYCFQPIPDTPFSVAVSMPEQNEIQVVAADSEGIPDALLSRLNSLLLSDGNGNRRVEVANWLFCNISSDAEKRQLASEKYYPNAREIYEYVNVTATNIDSCNNELFRTLLLSASNVNNFADTHWRQTDILHRHNVTDVYVITSAGFFTLLSTNFNNSWNLDRDILEEERYVHPLSFAGKSDREKIIFTVKTNTCGGKVIFEHTSKNINVGKTIYAPDSDAVIAVVGMTLSTTSTIFSTFFKEASKQYNNTPTRGHTTSSTQDLQFYLIDENGYIIASNRGNYLVGYFLGNVYKKLVEKLVDISIFEKHDFHKNVKCPNTNGGINSSGRTFKNLYQHLFGAASQLVNFIYSALCWTLTQLFLNPIASTIFATDYKEEYCTISNNTQNDEKGKNCVEVSSVYKLKSQSISHTGNLNCSYCLHNYSIESILGTNLALVTVAIDDTCNECNFTLCSKKTLEKVVTQPVVVDYCNRTTRYRTSQHAVCHKSTGNETTCSFDCTDHSEDMMLYLIISFSTCFAIIVVFSLCQRYNYHFYS